MVKVKKAKPGTGKPFYMNSDQAVLRDQIFTFSLCLVGSVGAILTLTISGLKTTFIQIMLKYLQLENLIWRQFLYYCYGFRNKKSTVIPRSDSVGSGSGRKFLAPTLSDPTVRPDMDRAGSKKRPARPAGTGKNLPHVTEGTEPRDAPTLHKAATPRPSGAVSEVHEWWSEQVGYTTQSSDDEAL